MHRSQLHIQNDRHGEVRIYTLRGTLDGETVPELERATQAALDDVRHVVIDLTGLTYIASNGIGVFIRCQHLAQTKGGQVVLLNPVASVNEVFNILGLAAIFRIRRGQPAQVAQELASA
jgi:anti-anti-sigma factor